MGHQTISFKEFQGVPGKLSIGSRRKYTAFIKHVLIWGVETSEKWHLHFLKISSDRSSNLKRLDDSALHADDSF